MKGFIEESIKSIRAQVGEARVICGMSGGVDSAVVAALIDRAIGKQMTAIFVDNGVLRGGEAEEIRKTFTEVYPRTSISWIRRIASSVPLPGLPNPRRNARSSAGPLSMYSQRGRRIGGADFLAQGTLYPDVIESRSAKGGPSATIKSHHNVGGFRKTSSSRS